MIVWSDHSGHVLRQVKAGMMDHLSGKFATERAIERNVTAEPFQVTLAATIERDRKRRSEAETDSFRSQGRFRGTKSELELLYEKQGPEAFIEAASKIFGP